MTAKSRVSNITTKKKKKERKKRGNDYDAFDNYCLRITQLAVAHINLVLFYAKTAKWLMTNLVFTECLWVHSFERDYTL